MSDVIKNHAHTIARAFVNWYITDCMDKGKHPSIQGAIEFTMNLYEQRKNPNAPAVEEEYVRDAARKIAEKRADYDGDWIA